MVAAKVAEQKPQPVGSKPPVEAPPVEVKAVVAQSPWGTIKGQIVWGGKDLPPRTPIVVPKMHNDLAYCTKAGAFLEDNEFVIDAKSKGIRDVFVWLAPMDKEGKLKINPEAMKVAPADEKVVIDQPICMFVPHALALREGQVLVVKNSAKVLHNFKWAGSDVNLGGNPAIGAGQQEVLKIKPDRYPISVECGIHPWMKAWIRCFDHPYYYVTSIDGKFEIKDAPLGPHRVIAWHGFGGGLGGTKWKEGRVIDIQPGVNEVGALEFMPPPKSD